MTNVYLAGIGFRGAGVRLVSPVRTERGARLLTLDELIATSVGTELTYHLTGLVADEGYTSRQDVITITSGGLTRVLERGSFSFAPDRAGLRRRLSSASAIPLGSGHVEIAIAVAGVGEFRLAGALRPFGPGESDRSRQDIDASAVRDGITVTVHGVGVAREETALEIEVAVGEGVRCAGIGGYAGHRRGATALALRDERSRAYVERWQEPGRFEDRTTAMFEPLHPDARKLELAVPYVFVEECESSEALALPITSPVEVSLGRYRIRVLETTPVQVDPRAEHAAGALSVSLDLGGWQGDRRVVLPGRVLVDGDQCDVGYRLGGRGIDATQPEPVDRVDITGARLPRAKTIGFTYPCVQVRGPWRIAFALA